MLSNYVLRNLYHAHFLSRLCYGICVCGNTFTTYLQPLRILQNRCIRLIAHSDNLTQVNPLAKKMHILLFDDLYYLHVAVFVYKVFHEMHQAVTVNLFTKLSSVYSLNVTRRVNNDNFLPRVRLDVCKRFITFQGVNNMV